MVFGLKIKIVRSIANIVDKVPLIDGPTPTHLLGL